MYLNHTCFDGSYDSILFIEKKAAYPLEDAEKMISSIATGNSASCTISTARSILLLLENKEAYLEGEGYFDEFWVDSLYREIKMLLRKAN